MKKNILVITALVTAMSASSAFAWWGDDADKGGKSHHCEARMGGKHGMKAMKLEKALDRSYTAEEITILNQARLIRKGNPNIKVGKVTPTKDGYKVTIVTKDNSLVKELDLAKNGMPLERYKMLEKKFAKLEKKS